MYKKFIAVIVLLILLLVVTFQPKVKEQQKYSMVFFTEKGTPIQSLVLDSNSLYFKPEDPVRKAATFGGWYTTLNCEDGTEFDFSGRITKSITIYAKWNPTMLTITYDLGEGYFKEGVEDNYVKIFKSNENSVIIKFNNARSPQHPDGLARLFVGWSLIPEDEYYQLSEEERNLIEEIDPFLDEHLMMFDENNNITVYAVYKQAKNK